MFKISQKHPHDLIRKRYPKSQKIQEHSTNKWWHQWKTTHFTEYGILYAILADHVVSRTVVLPISDMPWFPPCRPKNCNLSSSRILDLDSEVTSSESWISGCLSLWKPKTQSWKFVHSWNSRIRIWKFHSFPNKWAIKSKGDQMRPSFLQEKIPTVGLPVRFW